MSVLVTLVAVAFGSLSGACAATSAQIRYRKRYFEAQKVLQAADLDHLLGESDDPKLPAGPPPPPTKPPRRATIQGRRPQHEDEVPRDAMGVPKITQKQLNRMADPFRVQVELKRLRQGEAPRDTLEGMASPFAAQIMEERVEAGWD